MTAEYFYLTKENLADTLFCSSNLVSVAVNEDIVLQMVEQIKEQKTLSEQKFYQYENFKFYVEAITMEESVIKEFPEGEWLAIEYACDSTYVMKPKKDPFILGMNEVLKEADSSEEKAIIQDYIQDGIYWREEIYGKPQKETGVVYAQLKSSNSGLLEEFELYSLYQYDGTKELILLSEYLSPKTDEERKEQGKTAAKSLLKLD